MTTNMMVTLGLALSIAWIPIVGTILALQHHGVASTARRAIDALARDRRLQILALLGYFLVLMAVTVAYGIRHDYGTYAFVWDNILAGRDLCQGSDTPFCQSYAAKHPNYYGPLFNAFAALYFLHPLLPKVMFSGLFFASVVLVMNRALEPDLRSPVRFAIVLFILPFNPYFWAYVPGYGSLDSVPAFLSLAAVLCRVRRRLWLSGLLLGCGFLVKIYPLILLPFLMYERRRLLWAPALACAGLIAAGMGVSFLLWGESTLNPIPFAQDRQAQMLSIFRVFAGHPEIPRALFGTPDVSWASIYLMGLAGGTVWAVAAWRDLPVVGASMLGFLAVITSYKVGSAHYLMTFVLLAAYSVASVSRVSRVTFRPLFGVLIYLLFLEGFQVLYVFTRWLPPSWNVVRDFLGLPAFVLALIAVTTGLLFMEAGRDDKTASPSPRPP